MSTMILGPEQAFCTNEKGCDVLSFNPSLEDGGLSNMKFLDVTGLFEEKKPNS